MAKAANFLDLNPDFEEVLKYNSENLSKPIRTHLEIVQAAIHCFAQEGIEGATFEKIALKAGVSRPLIFKYFAEKEDLFATCVKYICSDAQIRFTQYLQNIHSPKKWLEEYLNFYFVWAEDYPDQSRMWLLFYHSCASSKKYANLNSEFVGHGTTRISAVLKELNPRKNLKELRLKAKLIQGLLAGAFVQLLSENKLPANYQKKVIEQCLSIAQS